MLFGKITGLDKKVSKLILGNDSQRKYSKAIKLWDHYFDKGGNAFDNSMYYKEGLLEVFLGNWIKSRKIEKDVVVISKAGNEQTQPKEIPYFIKESLDRLKLKSLDIFVLHHDNESVPPGEFIDVLNEQVNLGLVKSFGASNWKKERFNESVSWSKKNNKIPFAILNNNLSLAKMEHPMWGDCVSSNNQDYLDFLSEIKQTHFSWSSQARGFFIEDNLFKKILRRKFHTYLKNCFFSKDNFERKKRAKKLSKIYNCSINDIALAWVLCQNFPSFAIIGPKKINQLNFSLNSTQIKLKENEIRWLNLNKKI